MSPRFSTLLLSGLIAILSGCASQVDLKSIGEGQSPLRLQNPMTGSSAHNLC